MFGHPKNVDYNRNMKLYDWNDKLSRHLEREEIVAYSIVGGVMLVAFVIASLV